MDDLQSFRSQYSEKETFISELSRYVSFWPYILIFLIFCLISANIFLRYSDTIYESFSTVEVIDKAQDSEMSLPTAMTVFNRSMINLDNEIGLLTSFDIHRRVATNLESNVKYFLTGDLVSQEVYSNDWHQDFNLNFLVDLTKTKSKKTYVFEPIDEKLVVYVYNSDDNLIGEYKFNSFTNKDSEHKLPFEFNFRGNFRSGVVNSIEILPFDSYVYSLISKTTIEKARSNGDQLRISITSPNKKIGEEYINTLVREYDFDGIYDRQLGYKNTMDFVDSRSEILEKELEKVEIRKREFKSENKILYIENDASVSASQKQLYSNELFDAITQRDLLVIVKESIINDKFQYLPLNIGIDNNEVNTLISSYNEDINLRNTFLLSTGRNNPAVRNIESKINDNFDVFTQTIDRFISSIEIKIQNLEKVENQYSDDYKDLAYKEKILRAIERELSVKESLFLLLLQKREEAAINYAVIKPSIKVIDPARSKNKPVYPDKNLVFIIAAFVGLFLPIGFIFTFFLFDTKIHTKSQLDSLTNDIPVIGEVPHIIDKSNLNIISDNNSRLPLIESIRMIIANLNFSVFNKTSKSNDNVILVTSSVKGEGKTLISVNVANILASKYNKILLIGTDLRNPQIHKFLNISKDTIGLTDYIHRTDINSWNELLIRHNNIDILLSGTIPPDPLNTLSSKKFSEFINETRKDYDYVVIDSAPCLLVSDTFELSKHIDHSLYVVRANYTDRELINFLNECKQQSKLPNISLVFNAVGNSKRYGYKYGYQYGYKYGYKYGYNYGYGYGYASSDSESKS